MNHSINQALILAAGRGTRMGDLTADRPKPMLNIHGRPMLEYIIAGLRDAGVSYIVLVVGYREDVARDYFGDGGDFGVEIRYITQHTSAYGNGAAIHCARDAMSGRPFFLGFGDIIVDPAEYKRTFEDYNKTPSDLFITLVELEDVSSGSSVELDEHYNVLNIVEKPLPGTEISKLNCAGLFIARPKLFEYTARLEPSSRGELELADAIQAMAQDPRTSVRARMIQCEWADIADPEALREAEARIQDL